MSHQSQNLYKKFENKIKQAEYKLEEIEIINRLSKVIYKENTKILNSLIKIENNS